MYKKLGIMAGLGQRGCACTGMGCACTGVGCARTGVGCACTGSVFLLLLDGDGSTEVMAALLYQRRETYVGMCDWKCRVV